VAAPLIAVPAYHLRPGQVTRWPARGAYAVPEPYVEALRRAGGRAAILTEPDDAGAEEILEPFDGLLLIGGGDVEPATYGAEPSPTLYGQEPDRDQLEIALLRAADRMRVPTLAICRGLQVLNVAFGGTLHQHLPALDWPAAHRTPDGGRPITHDVEIVAGTRLRATVASPTLACSSHHHQGVNRVGEGLVVSARSADGLVEGLEREGAFPSWIVGVQWHPEDSAADNPEHQDLFDALIYMARVRWGMARDGRGLPR